MIKYRFDLKRATIPEYKEMAPIVHASSLADAIRKFTRKHGLDAPAYWDEPTYDRHMDITFKSDKGEVWYLISW